MGSTEQKIDPFLGLLFLEFIEMYVGLLKLMNLARG